MSQSKVLGSAAAAVALPLTGNDSVLLVLVGIVMVVSGLLLVRSTRHRLGAV
jgi:LPXTG-motif cell wall-anchored protein